METQEGSSEQDTESEVSRDSRGYSDIISNLQSLSRELDGEEGLTTDTSSVDGGGARMEGRASETGELRRRTGN